MKNRVGEKHVTNEGYTIEIIEYFGAFNCTIKFEDGTITKNKSYGDIVRGSIKNPFHKSVYNVGYLGVGIHKGYVKGKSTKIYQTWKDMLERCYDDKFQKRQPTYIDCVVAEEWHNFQNFSEWFEENYTDGFQLDKDILSKGNKIYSPETCVFVPSQINSLFIKCNSVRGQFPIGVSKQGDKFIVKLRINGKSRHLGVFDTVEEAFQAYKTAKEQHIKEMAEKWKDQISEPTYQALINYQVEITD